MRLISSSFSAAALVFAVLLTLTGCGSGGPSGADGDADAGEATVSGAEATSQHYVSVRFDRPAGAEADDPAAYTVTGPDGQRLVVRSVELSADRLSATLVTATQKAVQYHLSAAGSVAPFAGSTEPEPFVATAIALDANRVLVTFNERMDQTTAETVDYYRIVAADASTPREDVGDIEIEAAALDSNELSVVLTTTDQTDIEYDLTVAGRVSSFAGGMYIDPLRNTATFFGIRPVDEVPPQVVSVASTAGDTLVVTTSEPLDPASVDATRFVVTYCPPAEEPCPPGSLANLVVTDAELTQHGTQVVLTTLPQIAGVTYTVTVADVTDIAGNTIEPGVGDVAEVLFSGESDLADGDELPRVVGASSRGNTTVVVTFSKPMGPSAEDPANYSIVQENVNPEAGALGVLTATFVDAADPTAVRLDTRSQNEVTYRLTVVDVRDAAGNQLAPQELLVDPTSTTFAGSPPGPGELADSDGDGLFDNEEQRGYLIFVETTSGEVVTRQVTSDPGNPDLPVDDPVNLAARDTDGDGVGDYDEVQYGSDPRAPDTDGDTLDDDRELNVLFSNPASQDTDLDGLEDGWEYTFYQTSPILADTDGDQISDAEELLERNRDPRVADLPTARITVGEVRLSIDERYTYTDEEGETLTEESNTATTLARSEDTSFSRSDGGVNEFSGGFETGIETGIEANQSDTVSTLADRAFFRFNFSGHYEETHSTSWQTSQESAQSSQEAYESSLTKGRELTTTSTVTREVFGASIDVDLTVENVGDVAFTVSNLEVTVLQRSSLDPRRFIPVATLVANSTLVTGEPLAVNLGPFTPVRGPFIFTSREVFPSLVEELLRSPSGLIFKVANFDITDEFGRNFVFANQTARDRTAGITIDYGDGGAERYLVATNGAVDDKGYVTGPGDDPFVGGFDAEGGPAGLPLHYVLQELVGLTRGGPGSVPDGIVAGVDKVADSVAQGDDVQLIPPGTTGLSVGDIVVSAGADGILDTLPDFRDKAEVTSGYETSPTCGAGSENAGEACQLDTDCIATGTAGAFCNGPERLVRVGSFRNGDFNREWFVLYTGLAPTGADFGRILVKPGEDLFLAFLQDLDGDGLFAREEFLAGSTDSTADRLDNDGFGRITVDATERCEGIIPATGMADGIPDSVDSDRDGIGDYAEVKVGWRVSADGGTLAQVFSSPRSPDSDGDCLVDPTEADLRGFCNVPSDPRRDALCAFQDDDPVTQANAEGIIAGTNGRADSTAAGDDVQYLPVGTDSLPYGALVVGAGPDGILQSFADPADLYANSDSVPPATDPARGDTDADEVSDSEELYGYRVGLAIIDGGNEVAETATNGDDIQKVFVGNPVEAGGIVILPGPNRALDTLALGGDDDRNDGKDVLTDPLRRDTDSDSIADGLERDLGSNPADPADGADFRDTDLDGLTDAEEQSLGWLVAVNGASTGYPVHSNANLPDTDFDGLPDFVERDIRTDPNKEDTDGDGLGDYDEFADFGGYAAVAARFPRFVLDGTASMLYGTDPTRTDSDGDTLGDYDELLVGYRVALAGESSARTVLTNPLEADTDFDGVSDGIERSDATDATDIDTDDDGRTDGTERSAGTDPLVQDVRITVRFTSMLFTGGEADGPNNLPDWAWDLWVKKPTDLFPGESVSDPSDFHKTFPDFGSYEESCPWLAFGNRSSLYFHSSAETRFPLRAGQVFTVSGELVEIDSCSGGTRTVSCIMRFQRSFNYDDFVAGTLRPQTEVLKDNPCGADVSYELIID